ncbi:MAG TPA: Na(+)/H(+) antiporter subunit D [bacterium]
MADVYPGWPLIAWPLLVAAAPRPLRRWLTLLLPPAAGALVLGYANGMTWGAEAAGYALLPFRLDALSRIFAMTFLFFAWAANLYAWNTESRAHQAASQLYAASSVAAVLAGDLLTLLVCAELMAVSCVVLIWARRTPEAAQAGWRFLLVHLTSGALMFAGAFLLHAETGSWRFGFMELSPGAWLLLASLAINAAIPPVHAWLPDAYPESTPAGGVFLSAFTTKTAVYALARGFIGLEALVLIGVATALYGVVFALMQNDIRRLLSYHLVCQVGYMVAGIGLGTTLAVDGAVAHAVNNILYKGLLFMAAGAVMVRTGRSTLTELGGLARRMPVTFVMFSVGGLAISGMPWLNGFISKGMILTEFGRLSPPLELLLIASASGTFLSIVMKIGYYAFVAPAPEPVETQEAPASMQLAMAVLACGCFAIGLVPRALYEFLPASIHYEAYTPSHVLHTVQLLLWTTMGFLLIRRRFRPHAATISDMDWIYRDGLARPVLAVIEAGSRAWAQALELGRTAGRWVLNRPVFGKVVMDEALTRNPAFWLVACLVLAGWVVLTR